MAKKKVKKIYQEEEYPTFEFVIDETNDLSLSRVSLVADPAIGVKAKYFSQEKGEKELKLFQNEEQQIIAGAAMIPNLKILRKDDNDNIYMGYFTKATIKKMVEIFNKNIKDRSSGVINDEHTNKMVNAYVIGSWIIEDSYYDKSRFYGFDLPVGTWFLEVKVDDREYWENSVKGEGKYAFSIEGLMGIRPTEFSSQEDEWLQVLNELGWLNVDEEFKKFLKENSK